MEKLLRDKFRREPELRERLVQTGTRKLINLVQSDARYGGGQQQNQNGSEKLFWSVVASQTGGPDIGQNKLGKLLEEVRDSCANSSEIDDWIKFSVVDLMDPEDPSEIPCIRLDVIKDGVLIETINLENRALFKFGGQGMQDSNDTVRLFHESITGIHAALAIDKD